MLGSRGTEQGTKKQILGRSKERTRWTAPSRRREGVLLLALAGLVLALSAGPAFGATASVSGSTLTYTAAGGEVNNVTISLSGGTYTLSESTVTITPSAPCATVTATSVTCPAAGVTNMNVDLGDMNDALNAFPSPGTAVAADMSVEGGPGNDDPLVGGNGDDLFTGGPGPVAGPNTDTDNFFGGTGNNTISYANRTTRVGVRLRTGSIGFGGENCDVRVVTFTSPQPYCTAGEDDHFDGQIKNVIGGAGGDDLIGNQLANTIMGGPGTTPDVICGGLGVDYVDYSDRSAGVNVSLDGNLAPFPPVPAQSIAARDTCIGHPEAPPRGQPGEIDCIANDGQSGEGDCVGRDIENIRGGSGGDVLIGSDPLLSNPPDPGSNIPGENVLEGLGGDDAMDGRGGPDTMVGGDGSDSASYAGRGEPVNATIDGSANDGGSSDSDTSGSGRRDNIGSDVETVIGGNSDDTLAGSGAPNRLQGGPGNDTLYGAAGDDAVLGEDGNDSLHGDQDQDSLAGGNGSDSLRGGTGTDGLDGGPGDDSLNGGFGPDTLAGGGDRDSADYSDVTTPVFVNPNGAPDDGRSGERDNVASDVEGAVGGPDDDTLIGNDFAGTLDGRGGDDSLDGRGGSDTFLGGSGSDSVTYATRAAPVTIDLSRAGGDGVAGENDNITSSVEKVVGGSRNDSMTGDSGANTLSGGPGNDTLSGGSGFDLLIGDAGNDRLTGGNDTDTLHGGAGTDSLDGGSAADKLIGDAGTDTAMYTSRNKAVTIAFDGGAKDGERREGDNIRFDVENVKTGSGNDRIDTRDGKRSRVTCGTGRDKVRSDKRDRVARNCEVVNGKKRAAKKRSSGKGKK
jgi:Ca2+-binding RTX toxin-like protein